MAPQKTRLASRVHSSSELEAASAHVMKVKEEAEKEQEPQQKIKDLISVNVLVCDLWRKETAGSSLWFFHHLLCSLAPSGVRRQGEGAKGEISVICGPLSGMDSN